MEHFFLIWFIMEMGRYPWSGVGIEKSAYGFWSQMLPLFLLLFVFWSIEDGWRAGDSITGIGEFRDGSHYLCFLCTDG